MRKHLLIFAFIFTQLSNAQEYKFGKISVEELQQTADSDYPEAGAAILYRNQYIKFSYSQGKGFVQENQIYERIKIYNKEGFDYATRKIMLYTNKEGSNTHNQILTGLKAVTYNLNGTKITEDKLKKEGIFEESTNKYWSTTKITMPNIKEGSIIELQYTIQAQRIGIDDIDFQQMIPIKKLDFKLKTPEYLKYKRALNPKASFVPNFKESKDRASIIFTEKNRQTMSGRNGNGSMQMTDYETQSIDYVEDIITANLNNVPPLKDESYAGNLSNYQAKLIMELDRTEFPGQPIEYLSISWEQVTEVIYKSPDFGEQLSKKGYYENDINALLKGITDNQAKATAIFNYVKSKVKWNDYLGYTTDLGVVKAYKDGVGNVADINLMLTSMLRHAGLKANPVLISTRNNGIPIIPTRSGFNYVVSALEIDSGVVLLDASQKNTDYHVLPVDALNWLGRLIRQDGSSDWIELVPNFPSKETASLNYNLNEDLSATGKVRNQFTNYQAMNVRNRYENYSAEQMVRAIENGKGEIEVSEFSVDNKSESDKPIIQSYNFTLNNAAEDISGKLYLSPMLFFAAKENPFKEDKRNYPIDYIYPIADRYMVNIVLPEGYEIESLPQNTKFEFKGADAVFSYYGKLNGNMLQFIITFDINKTVVLPDDYEQYKKFYQLVVEKQNEKVVLKKI